jgi:Kef-type K+ transport system membrane component KefB
MKRIIILSIALLVSLFWIIQPAAASAEPAAEPGGASHGLNPLILVGIAVILIVAKLAGELFERVSQPAVLGELVGGIVVGSIPLLFLGLIKLFPALEAGVFASASSAVSTTIDQFRTDQVIGALAEIGVILLLFEVGLESKLGEMLEVGWSSLSVAVAGVVAPFFLGWGVAAYFIPDEAQLGHIFIGATLCATSVGITARVLKDLNRLQTRESRIILGAAVIDDVLGLLILAVVAGAIKATAAGETLAVIDIIIIAVKAVIFLIGAIVIGHYLMPQVFRGAGRLETRGVLLALSIAFCLLLAWVAALVGLAPIVGAFAAGLVLDEVHFKSFTSKGEQELHHLLAPVTTVLVPIFFVLMGLKVDMRVFGQVEVLGFAAMLTLAAIIGKQVCALAVLERGLNRLSIGLGMIPRGEVGLIFAGIGATLTLKNAQGIDEPVIGAATFGAVIIMVIVTTLVTPPVLKWSLSRKEPKLEEDNGVFNEIAEDSRERTRR